MCNVHSESLPTDIYLDTATLLRYYKQILITLKETQTFKMLLCVLINT